MLAESVFSRVVNCATIVAARVELLAKGT
jgi:hypothetical protein